MDADREAEPDHDDDVDGLDELPDEHRRKSSSSSSDAMYHDAAPHNAELVQIPYRSHAYHTSAPTLPIAYHSNVAHYGYVYPPHIQLVALASSSSASSISSPHGVPHQHHHHERAATVSGTTLIPFPVRSPSEHMEVVHDGLPVLSTSTPCFYATEQSQQTQAVGAYDAFRPNISVLPAISVADGQWTPTQEEEASNETTTGVEHVNHAKNQSDISDAMTLSNQLSDETVNDFEQSSNQELSFSSGTEIEFQLKVHRSDHLCQSQRKASDAKAAEHEDEDEDGQEEEVEMEQILKLQVISPMANTAEMTVEDKSQISSLIEASPVAEYNENGGTSRMHLLQSMLFHAEDQQSMPRDVEDSFVD